MKELVSLWETFMKEWRKDPKNLREFEMMWKPSLYDFMEWVSKMTNQKNIEKVANYSVSIPTPTKADGVPPISSEHLLIEGAKKEGREELMAELRELIGASAYDHCSD